MLSVSYRCCSSEFHSQRRWALSFVSTLVPSLTSALPPTVTTSCCVTTVGTWHRHSICKTDRRQHTLPPPEKKTMDSMIFSLSVCGGRCFVRRTDNPAQTVIQKYRASSGARIEIRGDSVVPARICTMHAKSQARAHLAVVGKACVPELDTSPGDGPASRWTAGSIYLRLSVIAAF